MKKELLNSLRQNKFPENIVNAFDKVRREDFIPKEFVSRAYEDNPLEIGFGQTISQPYTIAFMLMLLDIEDNMKILEVGSGSGYVLSLIDEICKGCEIHGIERIKELAEKSRKVLSRKKNISIIYGDGSKGLIEKAPFHRIIVSASAKSLPHNLIKQLSFKGILVATVGNSIVVVKKDSGENKVSEYPGFVFVEPVED